MSKNKKTKILIMLVDSLKAFRPDLADIFLCPVCFKEIPLVQKSKISEAHIVPRAAAGTLKTYLCVRCNNTFGTKQDKWFGEYLKIQQQESLFTDSTKTRSFEIDGIKINGNYKQENGSLNFYIYANRNPPDIIEKLKERHGKNPSSINLKVSFPILQNQHMVNVGFLTAGYLMWFGVLGYSWVFQDHLDMVRKQIMNPDKQIIPVNYLASFDRRFQIPPWVGMMPMANVMVPVMGINNHVVIFPPFCHPQLYESMKNYSFNISLSSLRKIGLGPEPTYGPVQSILCDQDLAVFPVTKAKSKNEFQVLWFREGEQDVKILHPVSEEEYERLSKLPNAITMNIKADKDFTPP